MRDNAGQDDQRTEKRCSLFAARPALSVNIHLPPAIPPPCQGPRGSGEGASSGLPGTDPRDGGGMHAALC